MRTKTRLTITLDNDLLGQVDTLIDNVSVKNRSHAIETLIKDSLTPSVQTAVILAGGTLPGSTNPLLLKLGTGTLFSYTLSMLKKFHIRRVIVCVDSSDKNITKTLGKIENFGLQVEYSIEKTPLGTGGAVKNAQKLIGPVPFLVIHGDVLTTLNLADLFEFHFNEKALATIAVKPRMGEPKYGQAFIQGNKIVRFLEQGAESGISIINTGVYVFDPKIFDVFPNRADFTLEKDVFPILAGRKQLTASIFQGIWYDVTMSQNYKEAQERWKEIAG